MKNLEVKISQSISKHCLIPDPDAPVIVTLSGGADSVALTSAMVALGYNCVAAHCNFHLRGEESMRDQLHAEFIATRLGIPCHTIDFDVTKQRQRTGESVEMACRTLRYDYFERLRCETGAQAVAVAHHQDDNIETMMLNLLRGTGIAGLTGIDPRRGNIIRPMLECSRLEIERYIDECGLSYVTDSSNLANDYRRNKIRNSILPAIELLFPDAMANLRTSIDNLREQYGLYTRMTGQLFDKYQLSSGDIDLQRLVDSEPDAELLLYEWLKNDGITRRQAHDIAACATKSGRRFDGHNVSFLTDRGTLRRISVPISDAFDRSRLHVSVTEAFDFTPGDDPFTIYLDADIIGHSPAFQLRSWHTGDRILPFGMNGSKKLSDIFSDAKVPADVKHRIPILMLDDDIIWVVGLRASRIAKVTPSTRNILRISYTPAPDDWIALNPRR